MDEKYWCVYEHLSEFSVGCAGKKGTHSDMQMAASACTVLVTAQQTEVPVVTSPIPDSPHINVQCMPCVKSKELFYGRILGSRITV